MVMVQIHVFAIESCLYKAGQVWKIYKKKCSEYQERADHFNMYTIQFVLNREY